MWHRRPSVTSVATLLLAAVAVSQAAAAGIVNGNFETGDFTGWNVQLHVANPPVNPAPGSVPTPLPGQPYYGAQVLTSDDIFVNLVPDVVVPPEGRFFALISSMPSGSKPGVPSDEPPDCPTTLAPTLSPPTDIDTDGFFERDVTILSQQFTVDQLPALIVFDWSYLAGENRDTAEPFTWLHDDFQAVLTPIAPAGPPTQILGVTAGNIFTPAYGGDGFYRGTFVFIDPSQLDGQDYQVLTAPPGLPTDCHHSGFGRTAFQTTIVPIPSTGTWEIKFFVGDDGGDALKTTGVLLDNVRVTGQQAAPAPVVSSTGVVLVTLMLAAVGIFGLAAGGVLPRPTSLMLIALLLFGGVLLLSHASAAWGTLRPAGAEANAVTTDGNANDKLAQIGILNRPQPTATRRTATTPGAALILPRATPTPARAIQVLPRVTPTPARAMQLLPFATPTAPRATPTPPARRTPAPTLVPSRPAFNTQTPIVS
jgi:hypothetical protein